MKKSTFRIVKIEDKCHIKEAYYQIEKRFSILGFTLWWDLVYINKYYRQYTTYLRSEDIKENWFSRFDKKEIAEKCLRWALATKPVAKEVKRLELEEEN